MPASRHTTSLKKIERHVIDYFLDDANMDWIVDLVGERASNLHDIIAELRDHWHAEARGLMDLTKTTRPGAMDDQRSALVETCSRVAMEIDGVLNWTAIANAIVTAV